MNEKRSKRKTKVGTVISNKMRKTIIVRVERLSQHKRYKRVVRRASKFKVHDEQEQAKLGDRVLIMECRPLSKEKRWRLVEVLK